MAWGLRGGECGNLKFEILNLNQKIQAGSLFLGLRWLDTALDFSIDALYSHPKLRQAGALHDTLIATKRHW
jgi:hypothetical protein